MSPPPASPDPPPKAETGDRSAHPAAAAAAGPHGPVYLEPCQVTTCVLDVAGRVVDKAEVLVSCGLRNGSDEERDGVVTATLRDTGQVVERSFRLEPGESSRAALPELSVMFPHPWWPWGRGRSAAERDRQGPRALYSIDLEVTIHGVLSDRRRVRFGLREVEWEETAEADGPAVLAINGLPLWEEPAPARLPSSDGDEGAAGPEAEGEGGPASPEDPSEASAAAPPAASSGAAPPLRTATWEGLAPGSGDLGDRFHDAVRDLAERGVSLLLVPWGDLEERDALLDACDERGLPVAVALWPDGAPANPDLRPADQLAEAREALRRLRNHPALVLWLGGLESPPPESLGACLRCSVRGTDTDGRPCRFAGESPCGHDGILDGNRPYRPMPPGRLA